jgi:bacillithiol biosynthesis deacetylase BshB1
MRLRGRTMTVLAVGAHPDDVDLYAGGLVASLTARGVDVVIVDLTRGELGTRGDPDGRAEEAREAARILGVTVRECLSLPDGGLRGTDPTQTRAMVETLRRHRPALILAPYEVDLHPDHAETARLVRRARFFARLPRFEADGDPCRPGPILAYEQKIPFVPDVVVNIDDVYETKLAAIRAFDSQFGARPKETPTEISEPVFHEMLAARARVHGSRIGATWGEAYRRDGPQAVHDPRVLLGKSLGGEVSR